MSLPIAFSDVLAAESRIRPHLSPSPLRRYPTLDAEIGAGVWVKHENHLPTNSFKARNALSAMGLLSAAQRRAGVVAATRGNYGLGLAWAGALLDVPVTLCVPVGNNAEKNAGMRGYGARLMEEGRDYDEAAQVAERLRAERGLTYIHATDDRGVIAGAATVTLEILRERPQISALFVGVGGGSQAVGALTVAATLSPALAVYGVQAAGASAQHDSWKAGRPVTRDRAETIADGLATRSAYALTFEPMRRGLAGFYLVGDPEIAEAVRVLWRTSHNLAEAAGATALAGLRQRHRQFEGTEVAVVLSGGNMDSTTARQVFDGAI